PAEAAAVSGARAVGRPPGTDRLEHAVGQLVGLRLPEFRGLPPGDPLAHDRGLALRRRRDQRTRRSGEPGWTPGLFRTVLHPRAETGTGSYVASRGGPPGRGRGDDH